jgi:hypothetical protein
MCRRGNKPVRPRYPVFHTSVSELTFGEWPD